MNDIIKQSQYLPTKLEDLKKFVLVGRDKLTSVKAEIRAIDKLDIATDVREQKKDEAQMLADALLDAEAKMGDLLKVQTKHGGSLNYKSGAPKSLPKGITHNQSVQFRTLSDNKDIIEEVKAEAKESDKLSTRENVIKKIKQKENKEKIKELKEAPVISSSGKYKTIVIDPPWDMKKIDRDVSPNQVGFDYPTMTQDELKNFEIPSEDNAHLYLWTTQKFIWDAKELMDYWGFTYIFTMVWNKNGGFQPFGLPQYNAEFCLFGRKGNLPFLDLKDFFVCNNWPRREHSRKPDEFYRLIERVSPAPRIDIFSREIHEGFNQYGNEPDKF